MTALTREEKARVLTDLADLISTDRAHGGRIWTDMAVRSVIAPLTVLTSDMAAVTFDELCRERRVIGSGVASYGDIEAAEASAARLLGRLLGEPAKAVA